MQIIKKNSNNKINFKSIYQYRSFIYLLFLRNIATIYKQTIMGPFWQILIPLVQSGLFTLIFSKVANLPTDDVPPFLFYASAMLAWIFFQSTWLKTSDVLVNFSNYFRNAYVPKIVIVVSLILENVFIFTINFFVFILIYLYYLYLDFNLQINFKYLILMPFAVLYLSILATSIGLIIACLSAKFRDLRFVSQYGIQIIFYGTPIIYSINSVPENYKYLFYLNPITYFIDFFRVCFFSTTNIDLSYLYASIIIFFIIFYIAKKFFTNTIGNVVDYV
jgi:lipopolysaccharide transport system permease protein